MIIAVVILALIGFAGMTFFGFMEGCTRGEFSRKIYLLDDRYINLLTGFLCICPSIYGIIVGFAFGFPKGILNGFIATIIGSILNVFIYEISAGLTGLSRKAIKLARSFVC